MINRIASRVPKTITKHERIRLAKLDYAFCMAIKATFRGTNVPEFRQLNNVATDAGNALLACKVPYHEWDRDTDESCRGK